MNRAIATGRYAALVLTLVLGVLAAGCSEDRPECKESDVGVITFDLVPAPHPPNNFLDDSFAFTGTLVDSFLFVGDPNQWVYQFRDASSGGTRTVRLTDIGYRLPLREGASYTLHMQNYSLAGTVMRGYGLVASDSLGVVALLVNDFEPYPSQDALVFTSGFPLEGLGVLFEDGGCDPRIENTIDYLDITNRRLAFLLGTDSVRLYQGSAGKLGDYTVRVYRAEQIRPKNPLKIDTQVSFAIDRTN